MIECLSAFFIKFFLAIDILGDELDSEFYISTGSEIISLLELSNHSLTTRTLLDGLKVVEVLDVDYRDHKVYWADMQLKTINRVATNTTSSAYETVSLLSIQLSHLPFLF